MDYTDLNQVDITINPWDIMTVLTINNDVLHENSSNLISKNVIVNKKANINLHDLSYRLSLSKIKKLLIFSISEVDNDTREIFEFIEYSEVTYIEMSKNQYKDMLMNSEDFMEYNKHCIYIFRDANFSDIKNIITNIYHSEINLGRGRSQKLHMLSPLDFRIASYLMIMFNYNYNYISSLNTFNCLTKDRYLPFFKQ